MKTLQEYLKQATEGYAVRLTADQLEQFDTYYQLLVEWNQKINLTAITDPEGVAVKHFADSLSFFNYCTIPEGGAVIDIGTGAGFPGIVLKIVRPDIQLTLLDSLKKRFLFLEDLLSSLGLEATFLQGRAEAYGQNLNYRESYDVAVSRAVAQLNTLSEYCLPFVKQGGSFVSMKGSQGAEEALEGKRAASILGGDPPVVLHDSLPDGSERTFIVTKKCSQTPTKYPRNSGKISKQPL
jgi:16S rRNA (guanine527-N7)-methyltransferase